MGLKYLLGILILLISVGTYGQEKMNFTDLDAKSYQLYEDEDWNGLRSFGEEGLKAGYDYYYFRMRLGVAEYKLNNFEKSATHFRKALVFNEGDPIALEYLYYSLLFSARPQEAKLIISRIPEATKRKMDIPSLQGINSIFFEGGSVGLMGLDNFLSNQPGGSMVEHYLLKNYSYAAGGLDLSLGSRLSMTIGVNRMKFNALQEVAIFSQFGKQVYDSVFQNTQSGLYIGGEWTLNPDWFLGFAGHFIMGDYSNMNYRPAPMGMDQFTYESFTYSDYVIEGSISHRFENVMLGVNTSFRNLGDKESIQSGLELIWYPRGNLNLYVQTGLDRLIPLENSQEGNWVFQGLAGKKVFSKLWLEVHAASGRMAGWTEKSAYVVYNNQDPILLRGGLNLILPELIKGISLNFRCQLQQRQHSWEIATGNGQSHWETKEYFTNSLIGGISWKF